jgi:hypothetical protein
MLHCSDVTLIRGCSSGSASIISPKNYNNYNTLCFKQHPTNVLLSCPGASINGQLCVLQDDLSVRWKRRSYLLLEAGQSILRVDQYKCTRRWAT